MNLDFLFRPVNAFFNAGSLEKKTFFGKEKTEHFPEDAVAEPLSLEDVALTNIEVKMFLAKIA